MRTKKGGYNYTISTMVTTDMRNKIIELATEANISQGEFVRDAVEHYISHLKSKANEQQLQQELAEGISEFDTAFNNRFFTDFN